MRNLPKFAFNLPRAARWWMTAFFIGLVFSIVARRFFADRMPWSADLPAGTEASLRLFSGIVIGMALQAVWWVARRAVRSA
jgi:hypothetical protein